MNPYQNSLLYRVQQEQLKRRLYDQQMAQAQQQQARSTMEQVLKPIAGSGIGMTAGVIPATGQMAGSVLENIPGLQGIGASLRQRATAQKRAMDVDLANSSFSPQSRPGENSFLVNTSSGLGSLLASLGMAKMGGTKAPALAFGALAGGEQVQGAMDAGKDPRYALLAGLIGGGAEAGLEKVGLDRWLGATGSPIKRLGTRMLTEGLQEGLQSGAQSAVQASYAPVDPMKALKQAGTEAFYGGIVGGLGDVGARGMSRASNVLKDTVQPANVDNVRQQLQQMLLGQRMQPAMATPGNLVMPKPQATQPNLMQSNMGDNQPNAQFSPEVQANFDKFDKVINQAKQMNKNMDAFQQEVDENGMPSNSPADFVKASDQRLAIDLPVEQPPKGAKLLRIGDPETQRLMQMNKLENPEQLAELFKNPPKQVAFQLANMGFDGIQRDDGSFQILNPKFKSQEQQKSITTKSLVPQRPDTRARLEKPATAREQLAKMARIQQMVSPNRDLMKTKENSLTEISPFNDDINYASQESGRRVNEIEQKKKDIDTKNRGKEELAEQSLGSFIKGVSFFTETGDSYKRAMDDINSTIRSGWRKSLEEQPVTLKEFKDRGRTRLPTERIQYLLANEYRTPSVKLNFDSLKQALEARKLNTRAELEKQSEADKKSLDKQKTNLNKRVALDIAEPLADVNIPGIKKTVTTGNKLIIDSLMPSIIVKSEVPAVLDGIYLDQIAKYAEQIESPDVITYKNAENGKIGWVDKKNGISNEPMMRLTLNDKTDPDRLANELTDSLRKYPELRVLQYTDNNQLDIINLSHYNTNYEKFAQQVTSLTEELELKGLMGQALATVVQVRHIGQDGKAPVSYKSVRDSFAKEQEKQNEVHRTIKPVEFVTRFESILPHKDYITKKDVELLLGEMPKVIELKTEDYETKEEEIYEKYRDREDFIKPIEERNKELAQLYDDLSKGYDGYIKDNKLTLKNTAKLPKGMSYYEREAVQELLDKLKWQTTKNRKLVKANAVPRASLINALNKKLMKFNPVAVDEYATYGLDVSELSLPHGEAYTVLLPTNVTHGQNQAHSWRDLSREEWATMFGHFRYADNPWSGKMQLNDIHYQGGLNELKTKLNELERKNELTPKQKIELKNVKKDYAKALEEQDIAPEDMVSEAFVVELQADPFQSRRNDFFKPKAENPPEYTREVIEIKKVEMKRRMREEYLKFDKVIRVLNKLKKHPNIRVVYPKKLDRGERVNYDKLNDFVYRNIGFSFRMGNAGDFADQDLKDLSKRVIRAGILPNSWVVRMKEERRLQIAYLEERMASYDRMLKQWDKIDKQKPLIANAKNKQLASLSVDNRYRLQHLETTLQYLYNTGYDYAYLPTPSTVIRVEQWDNLFRDDDYGEGDAPYYIDGEPANDSMDDLDVGDTVEWYGDDEYKVVAVDGRNVTLAKDSDITYRDTSQAMAEESDYKMDEEVKYELEEIWDNKSEEITPELASQLLADDDYNFDNYTTETYLGMLVQNEETATRDNWYNLNAYDETREAIESDYDLEQIYDNVWYTDDGGAYVDLGGRVDVEEVYQPSEYSRASSGDTEEIVRETDEDKSLAEDRSGNHEGVLGNYFDMVENLRVIGKKYNLPYEYVIIDDNDDRATSFYRVKLKAIKRTAY